MRDTHPVISRSIFFAALATAVAMVAGCALAQVGGAADWELRACAPPQSMPFSDRAEAGFENEIATIVAEELGARLTYDWTPFTEDLINLHFAEGTCDLIIGVPDGFERGLNTVAYYTSPYVMVYRADAGLDIHSLDDPGLAELELGVQGAGTPPQAALAQRGLNRNITTVIGGSAGSDDRLAAMVRAVERGEVDIGFGWGPAIAYYAERSEHDLVVEAVTPQFEPPSIFQSIPMTMAVRRNDTALRDALNLAIASRWDDIQAVLASYDVPLVPMPAPFVGSGVPNPAEILVDIGIVLPAPTGGRTVVAAINDIVGEAALQGALFAEGRVNAAAQGLGADVQLALASSPSPAAAVRAAERLLVVNGVDALGGGVGDGQAGAIAEIAARHGVPFLNVGSSEALPRQRCLATSFHLEPAPERYLAAMIDLYGSSGTVEKVPGGSSGRADADMAGSDAAQTLSWFVVHVDDDEGAAMAALALRTVEAAGDLTVGTAAVDPQAPTYQGLFPDIEAAGTDAVMVILPAAAQLTFLGQYRDAGGQARLAPYPYPVTQTRNYLAASIDYGVGAALPRLLAWETTLADGDAADLNARFTSRWGQPLDPTAWTAYEAVQILAQTAVAARSSSPSDLLAQLSSGASFDTAKGSLTFDAAHQLQQQLYAVMPVPGAEWGITLGDKLGLALLHRTLATTDVSTASCR